MSGSRAEGLAAEREEALLVALAARAEMARPDSPFYTTRWLIDWLDRELRGAHRAAEGWSEARLSAAARAVRARVLAARLGVPLAGAEVPTEPAGVPGTVSQVLPLAAAARFAPEMDLAVAAGIGSELWEEPCERWVRLPDDVRDGEHVALRVAGDSMTPLLHTGDTILVRLRARVTVDSMVVARVPDEGYVVKRVGRVGAGTIELCSLNRRYAPITIPRREGAVLGRVVRRWCSHRPEAPVR